MYRYLYERQSSRIALSNNQRQKFQSSSLIFCLSLEQEKLYFKDNFLELDKKLENTVIFSVQKRSLF